MTERTNQFLYGFHQPNAVIRNAKLSAAAKALNVDVDEGMIVRLNADDEFDLGLGTNPCMPFILWAGDQADDVAENTSDNAATSDEAWEGTLPDGTLMGVACNNALEVNTTQFKSDDSFVLNAFLTSPVAGGNSGRVAVGTEYTDMIFGIVSRDGLITNDYQQDAVQYHTALIFPTP